MTRRLAIVNAFHPIMTDDHEFMNNDHEFMIVDHDRMIVAHEFITSHHETLPGSHDSMTVVHARMNAVTYFDTDDHELMTVSHEFVMIGSVLENVGRSESGARVERSPRPFSGAPEQNERASVDQAVLRSPCFNQPSTSSIAAFRAPFRRCSHRPPSLDAF